jgi:hypothetical protein
VPFEHGLMLAREIRDARFVALEQEPPYPLSRAGVAAFHRCDHRIPDVRRSTPAIDGYAVRACASGVSFTFGAERCTTACAVVLTSALVRCLRPHRRHFPALSGRSPRHRPTSPPSDPYPCLYFAAMTSFEFMSMVRVHPEVPVKSNGAGLGPRR